jgi:SAM-dependent methyltransferase
VRFGLKSRRLRHFVEAEIHRADAADEPTASASLAEAAFVDRHGTSHDLDPGLRDRLKPSWRTMVDPDQARRPPTDEQLQARATAADSIVAEAAKLVEALTGQPLSGQILEIGCYDGAVAFRLARLPNTSVTASDMARYYVVQRPGEPSEAEVGAQQDVLAALRERTRVVAGVAPGSVQFLEDDITASALPPGTYDVMVSFEVLEHVRDLSSAFRAMHRLLKPGGIAYHDYNPFFSNIGGHSLGTLDFPWGHARLDRADFERYLRDLRPNEADQALRFYDESLNRMTLAGLQAAIEDAGLEAVAVLPWLDRGLGSELSAAALADVRRNYTSADATDLLGTFVSVVMRRPS